MMANIDDYYSKFLEETNCSWGKAEKREKIVK